MRAIHSSFIMHVLRSFPRAFASAFIIAFLLHPFDRWLKDLPIQPGVSALFAVGLGLISGGLSVVAFGHDFKRSERIARWSSDARRMALFSSLWVLFLSAAGFFILG